MLNMKIKNKWAWLLVMIMMVQLMVPIGKVSFAVNTVTVNSISVDENDIDIDDEFKLTITIADNGATGTVYAELAGSNFEPVNSSNKKAVTGTTVVFSLVRTGNSNSIPVTFTDTTGKVGSETIYIEEADKVDTSDDDDDDDTPTDKNPDLVLDMDADVQEFVAGQDATLKITLDVLERTATNIQITFTDDADDLPFIFEDSKPYIFLDKLTKNGTTIEKDITISPLAKSKVYGLNVKFEYENTSDDPYTKNVVLYVKVTNDEVEPILGVSDYKFSKERLLADGGKQAVVMMIKNSGTLEARNVRAQLKGFTANGLHIDKDVDTKAITTIEAGKEEMVYFNIKPSESASTGQYPLTLEMTYDDEAGNEYTKVSNIYVPVDGRDSRAIEMEVFDVVYPENIDAGDTFDVRFKVTNKSDVEAAYVELQLEYPAGFIPKSTPKKYIKNLGNDEIIEHTYTLMAKEDLESNHYDIYVNVLYQAEGDDQEESLKEYVGVGVDGRSGLGRPKILVEDYSFDGETVMAGEEFDLNLRFFNTSSDDIVKNIKVSVSSDDGVFSPVDSSSSFFIERIGRQDYSDYVLKLETKRDAQVKTYNLKLIMEYEDGEGNAYDAQEQPFKEEESLGIPVSQPVRLETGDIALPFEAFIGNSADIEVEFYNMGRSSMYNMFVKLEGDFRSQDGSYFVGNFETGKSDYFTASIIPEAEGEVVGKVVFTFEDALGNPSIVEKDFSFFATAAPEFNGNGDMEFPEGGDFPDGMDANGEDNNKKPMIYGGVIVFLLAGFVFVLRQRKKKKEALLMALEDDDE